MGKTAIIKCIEDALVAFSLDFSPSPVSSLNCCVSVAVFMNLRSLNDLEDTWIISSNTVSSISNLFVLS